MILKRENRNTRGGSRRVLPAALGPSRKAQFVILHQSLGVRPKALRDISDSSMLPSQLGPLALFYGGMAPTGEQR